MENKTKTIALIFTLYTALFAGYELWGPVSVVGDSAEAAVLRLGHTPAAALQPDSILVKLPDSTIGTYPLSAAMSDSVPWDFITDKPDSFQSKNHNHPISDVNNLIDSLNKKYNTADTNKLQQKITGAATTVTSNNLTVSSALISNSSGKIAVSPVTSAELGYLDGVTSNIQTQIGSKSDTSHNHALSDVTGLNGALSGKEPTITGSTEGKFWNGLKQWVNITIGNVLGLNDTITNHRTAIASKLNISDTSSLARKNHGHSQSQITGLVDTVTAHRNAINNKQPLDTDLTTIAALTHSNRHVLVSNGSSWTRRALEEADLPSLSAAKITSGTLDNARLSFNPDYFVRGTNNRRMILSNSTNPLVSTEYCTFFRMDNTDPSFDSRLTGGVGLGFKVINNSGAYSFELMGQTSGNGVLLFGGTSPAGERYPWRSIWHSGNFNPADYQPAITGTENKVLSIQADGSGVKTGSIYDNGNVALIGKTTATGGYRLEVEGNTLVNGNARIEGNLAMEAASPFLTITPYSNGGIVFNTPSSPNGQHAHWITRSANDGVLRISREVNGEDSLMMAFAPAANEILFDSDIYFSRKNLFDVCLSGEVSYNGISIIHFALGPIDTDNCPGIYLDPALSGSNELTLTGGVIDQRIFVRNGTTDVQHVEGCRIEPGQFRDFLKTGTGWTASGAAISGKTINVGHGTGDISVSNVSTVHINFTPTSTYTMTNGYVGQRVTVVVLSGSAQHWIQGATKVHKIVDGEFRDFIYTTAGWVASAADY